MEFSVASFIIVQIDRQTESHTDVDKYLIPATVVSVSNKHIGCIV